jgi:hypothetical protein
MDLLFVPPIPSVKTDFGWRQIVVSVVIWISLPFDGNLVFSDFGIVAFLPVHIFYDSVILPLNRLTDLPWNIIFMLMSGNGLRTAVSEYVFMHVIHK